MQFPALECTPTITQDYEEHTLLPVDCENCEEKDSADPSDPIEEFSDNDTKAAAGRSHKHPRAGSEDGTKRESRRGEKRKRKGKQQPFSVAHPELTHSPLG